MLIGYVRVSTAEQNAARQEVLMQELGAEKVFVDKASGKNVNRPQLNEMLAFARQGDTIVVESISRFARNTKDLLELMEKLTAKGVGFISKKEAIDLSQETFVSAYLHMESCPPGAEKPWLCRIAVNKAKDHLKSAYNRRMAVTEAPGDTAPALAAAQNVPSLEAECETRADAGLARECIEGLAEPYRTVSVLYFMQEWPVEAIARQLGRMPKTVHTQLYRAKKMLRRELAAVG